MSTNVITPDTPRVPVLPADPASPPQEAERQRADRRKAYGPLLEYLKATCKKVETEDESGYLDITGQQNKCQAYYDGRQYGSVNNRTGEWEDSPYDQNEFRPVDNRYKEQVDKLDTEMARSGTDLAVEAIDKTDSAMVEAAEYLKSRVDANRKRLFTQHPEFVLAENKALLLKTITYRYCYFDKHAEDGPREKRPKFGPQAVGEEKSLGVCAVCRSPRSDETQPCPKCGSTSVKQLSTSPVELVLPDGEEEVSCGLPRCVHADPGMVKVSLNARNMQIASSPSLIWTQMVEQGKLERMFRDIVIPSGDDDADRQAEYSRDNESAVSNSPYQTGGWMGTDSTAKGGEQLRKRKFKLIWLDSWVYGDYVSQREEKLPGGQTLPMGTPLIKLFPKGMCIAKVGDTPLALYSEDKNKKWSACVYGLREGAWHGSGTNALIPIQVTINDLLSYRVANVYYNTFTREFIRPDCIDGATLPTLTTVCKVTQVDENQKIVGNVYDRAPGSQLPPEVRELAQEQAGALQEQAGTSSMSQIGTAAQQDGLGTATGIAYMRDQAVGRMGPNLMLKAAMDVETAFQIAELEQNNYSRQQLLAFGGLKPGAVGNLGYTQRGIDAFINCDIRASFSITPVPGSWMPSTEQEKKADALAMADVSGKVQDPEVLANVAKALKQPMQVGGFNATQREAARRIEEFGKVVGLLASRGLTEATPEIAQIVLMAAANAQLNVEMDNHAAYVDFYKDWWTSDESRNASPLLKLVVETRTIEHRKATVAVAVGNAQDAKAGQEAVNPPPDPQEEIVRTVGAHELEKDKARHDASLRMEEQQQKAQLDMAHEDMRQSHEVGIKAMDAVPDTAQ